MIKCKILSVGWENNHVPQRALCVIGLRSGIHSQFKGRKMRNLRVGVFILFVIGTQTPSTIKAQQQLDSLRTNNLLGFVHTLSSQFYTAAMAYYNHNGTWPKDSSSLVQFALRNSDTLQLEYLKTLAISPDSSNYLEFHFDLAPSDIRLKKAEAPSKVLKLVAIVRVSPLRAGSSRHTVLAKILEGAVLLPESDSRYVTNVSAMYMTLVRTQY